MADFIATDSNRIEDNNATTNYSANAYIQVGDYNGGAFIDRALLHFDLSSIPAGVAINSAVLRLYDEAHNYSSNTRTMRVYRMIRAWVASQSTWNIAQTSVNWGTAGASNTTTDREATDIGSISMPSTEVAGYVGITLSTSAIAGMISGGGFTNNGFLLKMDTESDDMHEFSDETVTNQKPTLVISYGTAHTKDFTENIVVSDSMIKATTRSITDGVVNLTDNIVKASTRTLTDAGIVLSEVYSTVLGYFKSFSETAINLTDNYADLLGKGLEFNEDIGITDSPFNHVAESYDETNENGWFILGEYGKIAVGAPFTVSGGSGYSHKVTLYLKKTGSPTGNVTLVLCTLNGSYRPLTTLATSDTILDISTLTTSYELFDFEFLGNNQPLLTDGVKYGWYVVYTNGDASNNLNVGMDSTNGYGEICYESTNLSSWDMAAGDMIFYVYTNNSFFKKDITRSLSDTTLASDNTTKASTRSFLDNVGLTELFEKIFAYTKDLSDSIDLTESFSKAFGFNKTFTDNIDSTDTEEKIQGISLTDNITISDSIRRMLNGVLMTIWTLTSKATATWTKVTKATSTWVKSAKSISNTWTIGAKKSVMDD